ncbi:MAG: rfbA [Firmicutes bacterium]|nr:rfbA [Bacillota bacterium]
MYNLRQNIDILLVLVQKELKVKYKNSLIGFLWSILNPVVLSIIFYFAFKIIIRVQTNNYPLFLTAGLFLWQWFQVSLLNSLNSFIHNRSLVKKLAFNRYLLPMSIVVTEMIHLIASLPALFIMMVIFKVQFTANMLFLPIIIVESFILVFAISLMFSITNVLFRDLERIILLLLQVVFYATPIVYTANMIPEEYKIIMALNPFLPIFEFWRSLFLGLDVSLSILLHCLGSAVIFLLLAIMHYKKYIHLIAERL